MTYPDIAQQVSSQDEWDRLIENDIKQIAESATALLAVRKRLVGPAESEPTLAGVEQREGRVRPFLVGGITTEGEYRDNALARFTDRFLGVRLDSPKRWVKAQRDGLDAAEYVTVTASETDIVSLLETVDEQLTAVIRRSDVSSAVDEPDIEALLDSPEDVVDEMQNVLTGLLDVTAQTHPFMFFAYTTRSVSRRYLEEAYPGLDDEFQDLADVLGLHPVFRPDLAESDKREAYTVWGHEEDGIFDRLYQVNNAVWEAFGDDEVRSDLSYFFDHVPDPGAEFERRTEESLADLTWTYPSYIEERMRGTMEEDESYIGGCSSVQVERPPDDIPAPKNGTRSSDDPRYGVHLTSLIVENGVLDAWRARTVNTSGYSTAELSFVEPISLFRYLDDIMPGVFLGQYELDVTENGVRAYHVR